MRLQMKARRGHGLVLRAVLLLLLPALPLFAQEGASDQKEQEEEKQEEKASPGLRFRMRRHPRLSIGKVLRVDFRSTIQLDFRDFSPAQKTHDEQLFELHRARVGIEGRFLKHFEYEVEHELGDVKNPWRDLDVNFRYFRRFQIRVGRFKIPFSLDELTGPTNLDFPFRSRIAKFLAPARDTGIEAHGRFFNRGLNYQAGFFKQDGDNARTDDNQRTGQRTFAGRLTGTPLRLFSVPAVLKDLEIGGAFTSSPVPEGLKSLRGKTVAKKAFFPGVHGEERFYVRGQRLRLGTELRWMPGPFSVKGEFIHAQEQRKGQGLGGEDLPDLISRGWYLTGTWVLTGEKKAGGVEPHKGFLLGRGIGAVELAGRYEQIRFGSSEHPGRPSRSPRAANVLGNSDRVWTFGVNWYLNGFMKVQLNGIREKIEDPQRTPMPGHQIYWVKLCRLQLVL